MKNRILFISLAVVLALSVGLTGCGDEDGVVIPDEPTVLVIGTARDTDESLAIFEGLAAGPIMREFVAQTNADGGVRLKQYDVVGGANCTVDLEIDRREINVGTWDVGDITADICSDIEDGDVHFLWGGPGTDCIFTQAPIANVSKTVLLTFEGGATSISNNPLKLAKWPYVFITLSYSDWYQLPVLADMLEEELSAEDGAVKAYVVHIAGEHGDEYLATANATMDVVANVELPFDPGALDAVTVVTDAIAALGDPSEPNYDIFCCFAYPSHVMPITGVAMAFGFNPPAMIVGPGGNFGFYAWSFLEEGSEDPCYVDGIMSFTIAAYDAKPEITEVYNAIAARLTVEKPLGPESPPGIMCLDYWGIPLYWAGLEMWLAAVETVGYVDQTLLRDALAAFEAAPVETVLADETWFRMYGLPGEGGGNLDYLCHTGSIGQWQDCGTFETVGPTDILTDMPNYIVTANVTYPMTDLWFWLS